MGPKGLLDALSRVCSEGQSAAEQGYQLIVLSDRMAGPKRVPISSLLALGALHHHLIETRHRMKVGLIVETAEAREVHHICVLLGTFFTIQMKGKYYVFKYLNYSFFQGYGADAICPYLVFELASDLRQEGVLDSELSDQIIYSAYSNAIETGIAKVSLYHVEPFSFFNKKLVLDKRLSFNIYLFIIYFNMWFI